MKLKVALAQIETKTGRPEANTTTVTLLARQAARAGANLLLLPELWAVGNALPQAQQLADRPGRGVFAAMKRLALDHRLYVAGSHLESGEDGTIYNRAVLYDPIGAEIAAYRKVHLFRPMGEANYLAAGRIAPVWDLPWGKTALAVCYDLRFPELFRVFREAGAELLILPAEWPIQRVAHWRILLQARAIENQMAVIGCNQAGRDAQYRYAGHSMIIGPQGRVIAEAEEKPTLLIATLDTKEVAAARKDFPVWEDRRPAVYRVEAG